MSERRERLNTAFAAVAVLIALFSLTRTECHHSAGRQAVFQLRVAAEPSGPVTVSGFGGRKYLHFVSRITIANRGERAVTIDAIEVRLADPAANRRSNRQFYITFGGEPVPVPADIDEMIDMWPVEDQPLLSAWKSTATQGPREYEGQVSLPCTIDEWQQKTVFARVRTPFLHDDPLISVQAEMPMELAKKLTLRDFVQSYGTIMAATVKEKLADAGIPDVRILVGPRTASLEFRVRNIDGHEEVSFLSL